PMPSSSAPASAAGTCGTVMSSRPAAQQASAAWLVRIAPQRRTSTAPNWLDTMAARYTAAMYRPTATAPTRSAAMSCGAATVGTRMAADAAACTSSVMGSVAATSGARGVAGILSRSVRCLRARDDAQRLQLGDGGGVEAGLAQERLVVLAHAR